MKPFWETQGIPRNDYLAWHGTEALGTFVRTAVCYTAVLRQRSVKRFRFWFATVTGTIFHHTTGPWVLLCLLPIVKFSFILIFLQVKTIYEALESDPQSNGPSAGGIFHLRDVETYVHITNPEKSPKTYAKDLAANKCHVERAQTTKDILWVEPPLHATSLIVAHKVIW